MQTPGNAALMRLADLEGRDAWTARPDSPGFPLAKGEVRDSAGRPVELQSA